MNNLRILREERGLRQEELGKSVYLASSAISAVENGRRTMSEDMILRLCAFFGVSSDYLLGRTSLRRPVPRISEEELALIEAYRRADDKSRAIVRLALSPGDASKE